MPSLPPNPFRMAISKLLPQGSQEAQALQINFEDFSLLILNLGRSSICNNNFHFDAPFQPNIVAFDLTIQDDKASWIEKSSHRSEKFPKAVAILVRATTDKNSGRFADLFSQQAVVIDGFALQVIQDSWRHTEEQDLNGFTFAHPACVFRGHEQHKESKQPALNETNARVQTIVSTIIQSSGEQAKGLSAQKMQSVQSTMQKIQQAMQTFPKTTDSKQLDEVLQVYLRRLDAIERNIFEVQQMTDSSVKEQLLQQYKGEWKELKGQFEKWAVGNMPKPTEKLGEVADEISEVIDALQRSLELVQSTKKNQRQLLSQTEIDETSGQLRTALREKEEFLFGRGHHSSSSATVRLYCFYPLLDLGKVIQALHQFLLGWVNNISNHYLVKLDFQDPELRGAALELYTKEVQALVQDDEDLEVIEQQLNLALQASHADEEKETPFPTELHNKQRALQLRQKLEQLRNLETLLQSHEKAIAHLPPEMQRDLHYSSNQFLDSLIREFEKTAQFVNAEIMQICRDVPIEISLPLLFERMTFFDFVLEKKNIVTSGQKGSAIKIQAIATMRYAFDVQLHRLLWFFMYQSHMEKSTNPFLKQAEQILERLETTKVTYQGVDTAPFKSPFETHVSKLQKLAQLLSAHPKVKIDEIGLDKWLDEARQLTSSAWDKIENSEKQLLSILETLQKTLQGIENKDLPQRLVAAKEQLGEALLPALKKSNKQISKLLGALKNLLDRKKPSNLKSNMQDLTDSIASTKQKAKERLNDSDYEMALQEELDKILEQALGLCKFDEDRYLLALAEKILQQIQGNVDFKPLDIALQTLRPVIEEKREDKLMQKALEMVQGLSDFSLTIDTWLTSEKRFEKYTRLSFENLRTDPWDVSNNTHIPVEPFN